MTETPQDAPTPSTPSTPAGPDASEAPARRTSRMSRARLDGATFAAVLIPVAALVLALFVDTGTQATGASVHAPVETSLSRATVVCPPGGSEVAIASASGGTGEVDVKTGGNDRTVALRPGRAARLSLGRKPAVITGRDSLAPGLVASRFSEPLATVDCRPPQFDQWFTGVGAGAKHRSVLQLVNPDAGRAVIDVVVLGRTGPVDVPALRGLAIRGGESRIFDLAKTIPRRDDLALHVQTLRGRISASVLDSFRELGQGQQGQDGLAAQDAPSRSNLLLGLPAGAGQRTLVLANPGPDEGRATIRLVGADAIFTPRNVPEVVLPPESVVRVPLAPVLRGTSDSADQRPYGLQVESSVPTTAGLMMFVGGDLAHGTPTPLLAGPATIPLPDATRQTLVLAGAANQGLVTVQTWDAAGKAFADRVVSVGADRGYEVRLPRGARLVSVVAKSTVIAAVVLATNKDGATLVRLREPALTGLVPHVAPALP